MSQKLNTIENKLKFHCSNCFATWQLFIIQSNLLTNSNTKCLNNCLAKWRSLLTEYCQEQIILDFTRKEQTKDENSKELADWLNQLRKQNKPK